MLRGSYASSVLSNRGSIRSLNSSQSSLQGGKSLTQKYLKTQNSTTHKSTVQDSSESSQDDLNSYLSSFGGSKSTKKKKHSKNIDWEKLVEGSDGEGLQGLDYEANVYGSFEELSSDDEHQVNNFLKPPAADTTKHRTTKTGKLDERMQQHSQRKPNTSTTGSKTHSRSSAGNKLSDLKYVRGSTDWVNMLSGESESISISDTKSSTNSSSVKQQIPKDMYTPEDSDTDVDLLACVKGASNLSLSDRTDTNLHQVPLPVPVAVRPTDTEQSVSHIESLSKGTDSDYDISLSESLELGKNVFSIDQLDSVGLEGEDDGPENGSISDNNDTHSQSVNTESSCRPNIANVFSVADLKGKETVERGSMKKPAKLSSRVVEKSPADKHEGLAKKMSGLQSGKRKTGFKFSSVLSQPEPVRTRKLNSPPNSDIEELSSVATSGVSGHEPPSELHSYSHDDDFESETLSDVDSNGEISYEGTEHGDESVTHDTTNASERTESGKTMSRGSVCPTDEEDERDCRSTTSRPRQPKPRAQKSQHASRHKEVTTEPPPANVRSFIATPVMIGPHYGKEYLNPSPILPHVVSADALEVLTSYSPSTVALTDMLRAQLYLTKQLVANSRQLVENLSSSISADYHYTTLEETKEYIEKHRPKVITASEAMKLVEGELF